VADAASWRAIGCNTSRLPKYGIRDRGLSLERYATPGGLVTRWPDAAGGPRWSRPCRCAQISPGFMLSGSKLDMGQQMAHTEDMRP
jgi:hypothetical protein